MSIQNSNSTDIQNVIPDLAITMAPLITEIAKQYGPQVLFELKNQLRLLQTEQQIQCFDKMFYDDQLMRKLFSDQNNWATESQDPKNPENRYFGYKSKGLHILETFTELKPVPGMQKPLLVLSIDKLIPDMINDFEKSSKGGIYKKLTEDEKNNIQNALRQACCGLCSLQLTEEEKAILLKDTARIYNACRLWDGPPKDIVEKAIAEINLIMQNSTYINSTVTIQAKKLLTTILGTLCVACDQCCEQCAQCCCKKEKEPENKNITANQILSQYFQMSGQPLMSQQSLLQTKKQQ